jgi:hypothetical protein
MQRSFRAGDRVFIHEDYAPLGRSCLGTIQRGYVSAPGYYEVRIDITGEIRVIGKQHLAPLSSAPSCAGVARAVG